MASKRFRPSEALHGRTAIIDIGSNSIRLVVYDGPARVPAVLFNEKVMVGLGRGLVKDGLLSPDAIGRALIALGRFRRLTEEMGVATVRTVATAAVRDAANGPEFLTRIEATGLAVELLSGDDEAAMAGEGVLAAIPDANGIVGDLGGGSLELIRIGDGAVHERTSLPLGVLRAAPVLAKGEAALEKAVGDALARVGWRSGAGQPFYLVGGSWRALARLDMHLTGFPLPIVHQYRMAAERPRQLLRIVSTGDRKRFREAPGLSSTRLATLPEAAGLLAALVSRLGSSALIASAFGLREGLLFSDLPPEVRALDPLIAAAHEEAARQGRFPEHGDLLDQWIAPLFDVESGEDRRLRHVACLLADVGWRAHPEFRAERGLDFALHGNWVGIDARGRAMLGQALFTSFGGGGPVAVVDKLLGPDDRARAERWGYAIRLGQRLGGGAVSALEKTSIGLGDGSVVLRLGNAEAALFGESIERRLKLLAATMGRRAVVG